jgi:hypothetical protein
MSFRAPLLVPLLVSLLCPLLLSELTFAALALAPTQPKLDDEWYPYGEKPGLSRPLAPDEALDLEMARGEYEVFSVRLTGDAAKVQMGETGFEWKTPAPALELQAFQVGVHQFAASSFKRTAAGEVPDILMPTAWISSGSARMPVDNLPSRPLFTFEVRVPESATPGKYEGNFHFQIGTRIHRVPIRLVIHSAILPRHFALAASFGFSPWGVLKKHYGKWDAKEMDLYRLYSELAAEHRIDLHKFYVKFPDTGAEDPLAQADVPTRSFLAQLSPLLEARMLITDLPVPDSVKNPVGEPHRQKELRHFWQRLDSSVVQHSLKQSVYVYFADEPKPHDLPQIARNLKMIRQWAPHLRFLVTTPYRPVLDGSVDLWCENLVYWEKRGEATPDFFRERKRKKGEDFWLYVSCNSHGCDGPEDTGLPDLVMDRPSAYQRIFPWMAFRYGAGGVLYYDTVYGYGQGGKDSPWKDAFSFTGYGEGNLFYPCTPDLGGCQNARVAPSLRLKILRDGFEDAQILRMAREKGAPVDAWVAALIHSKTDFPQQTRALEELKRQALRALDSKGELRD